MLVMPEIKAFNFVILGALGGGVTTNMSMDLYGKSLSSLIAGYRSRGPRGQSGRGPIPLGRWI